MGTLRRLRFLASLGLVGLGLPGCVEDTGAAGDYCRDDGQCDEGLVCVELTCREPFAPVPDSGPPRPIDMFVPPRDLGASEDMSTTDLGATEDLGAEEDMGAEEDAAPPADLGTGEDLGPAEDMGG